MALKGYTPYALPPKEFLQERSRSIPIGLRNDEEFLTSLFAREARHAARLAVDVPFWRNGFDFPKLCQQSVLIALVTTAACNIWSA
jgi:hypothetical protein